MRRKKKTIVNYCLGCQNCLNFRCDILGEITEQSQAICKRAGYRRGRFVYPTAVRRFCWKKGAE